jgi:hypothetical protein
MDDLLRRSNDLADRSTDPLGFTNDRLDRSTHLSVSV